MNGRTIIRELRNLHELLKCQPIDNLAFFDLRLILEETVWRQSYEVAETEWMLLNIW